MTQVTEGDGKTVLSLATERKKLERSFQDERKQMVAELTDLGLPVLTAEAIAGDVLFADWLLFKSQDMLRGYGLDSLDAGAVIELFKLIRIDVSSHRD